MSKESERRRRNRRRRRRRRRNKKTDNNNKRRCTNLTLGLLFELLCFFVPKQLLRLPKRENGDSVNGRGLEEVVEGGG